MNLHKPCLFVSCLLVLVGCTTVRHKDIVLTKEPPMPLNIPFKASASKFGFVTVHPAKTNITLAWEQYAAVPQKPLIYTIDHSQDCKTWSTLTNFGVASNITNYTTIVSSTNSKDFFRVGVRYLEIVP